LEWIVQIIQIILNLFKPSPEASTSQGQSVVNANAEQTNAHNAAVNAGNQDTGVKPTEDGGISFSGFNDNRSLKNDR
jgi:hypothetical protein